ncbi:MAG: Fe(2+) transporter permease subunit FeoB [Spirochaetes bacterium]|jgi:ferrous iron transport protein B|nr:Fe(2+) transporter permease subunit FeoB [Spirochaetota bacterium]
MKKIAIAGNPNCGKSTLFNSLTGGRQKIGNWPGVTVEQVKGRAVYNDISYEIIDLPGIYSLSAHSDDERVSRDFLLSAEADLIVNIVDAANLEQNLYLTTQLLELKIPMILLINRIDIANKKKMTIDTVALQKKIGCPVLPISAISHKDIKHIREMIFSSEKTVTPTATVEYPNEVEDILQDWSKALKKIALTLNAPPRWVALKLLENDTSIFENPEDIPISQNQILSARKKIESLHKDDIDIIIADYRYGFIHGICRDIIHRAVDKKEITDRIDNVVLHNIFGIPIFMAVMYLTFQIAINVSALFIDFFDILFGGIFVDGLAHLLHAVGSPQILITILSGGAGAGIQTVATFIPILFFMFLMLAILEDSGYMARAAFVMDRFMRIVGLPGKSFVPMIVGFGCTVPAIMGARILENRRDKLFTIFLSPFMSCGARLPVYVLFCTAFFPNNTGFIVFTLYISGIAAAILTGLLLKRTIFKGNASNFIMELPTYNLPRARHILIHTWIRLKEFLTKAGVLIIGAVMLLSLLNTIGTDGTIGNENSNRSVLSTTARAITPILEPMGVEESNWPAAVALITGIFAKESIIGTLNSLYNQDENKELGEPYSLSAVFIQAFSSIKEQGMQFTDKLTDPFGFSAFSGIDSEEAKAESLEASGSIFAAMRKNFRHGPLQAFAYLLFILLYIPCVGAIGALMKEAGKLLGSVIIIYLTLFAWIVSTLFYQITVARSITSIAIALGLAALIALFFYMFDKFYYKSSFSEEE